VEPRVGLTCRNTSYENLEFSSHMMIRPLLGLFLVGTIVGSSAAAYGGLPTAVPGEGPLPSLADMLERVNPAVVNIATATTVQVRNPLLEHPFFRRYFGVPNSRRQVQRTQSVGSGVVVDAQTGHIVTNSHVVARADEIEITLSDGRSVLAQLVGHDPQVDLAVLKIDPDELAEIGFADSADLRVGDFVVAIGNPFGLKQTVTSGIVSALGRSGLGIEGYEDFIQTDASINPGNSGGALVDLNGKLVGINTAIVAPSGGNVGIGFAIPANMVRAVMDEILEHGEVRRGFVGVSVQDLNRELARAFNVDRRSGVVVVDIEPGSAAEKAGLQQGDIITKIGQRNVARESDFHSQAAIMFIGDEISVELVRDGKTRTVALEIEEDELEYVRGQRVDPRLQGIELQNFWNPDDAGRGAGILVSIVERDSRAYAYGLRPGDILVGANRRSVQNLVELREAVGLSNQQLLLRVYRNGAYRVLAIR
jgi:Do/DeqQ family serine protease